jgi:hypothetical protein
VDAFDPDELDVAGGRGAGDESVRAGRIEPGERVGEIGRDLTGLDDDQVKVRHQGERAAALGGTVVQDDRAGLSDGGRAAGDDARQLVELGRGQRGLVAGQRDPGRQLGQPAVAEAGGAEAEAGGAEVAGAVAARAARTRAMAAGRPDSGTRSTTAR